MTNREEIERRRTFAIISHPDAGKTTLTEKLLLYGGAINQAGSVKGKQSAKHAVSDWMDIEKQRGISVTSSVLQFNYAGKCVNILDTPGHQDFSEDTYRTLMAADSAVMVIDAAKGVEEIEPYSLTFPRFKARHVDIGASDFCRKLVEAYLAFGHHFTQATNYHRPKRSHPLGGITLFDWAMAARYMISWYTIFSKRTTPSSSSAYSNNSSTPAMIRSRTCL